MNQTRQGGFSLVELMISVAIGLGILSSTVYVVTASLSADNYSVRTTKLVQELRNVMTLMTRDLRRAGFYAAAENDIRPFDVDSSWTPTNSNPFTKTAAERLTVSELGTEAADSCVTYSYDVNGDTTVDNNERFGFRLRSGAVEMRQNGAACTSVTAGDWLTLTDTNTVSITQFQFTDPVSTTAGIVAYDAIQIQLTGVLPLDTTISRQFTEWVRVRNDRSTATASP